MRLSYVALLGSALLSSQFAMATFLPRNRLHLEHLAITSDITETDFREILARVANVYGPIVQNQGARLVISPEWKDETVNAFAEQKGSAWLVHVMGGLARRPEVTKDGLASVVCHELGHHLGGHVFYSDEDWAAAEGQADYFAAHGCLPQIWGNDTEENAKHRTTVHPLAKVRCNEAWQEPHKQDLCYRIADASLSMSSLLAYVDGKPAPHFETPDVRRVKETLLTHPPAQCRLDTSIAGALCGIPFDKDVIPGKNLSQHNSEAAEKVSAQYNCHASSGVVVGVRPSCWYRPSLSFLALQQENMIVREEEGNGNGDVDSAEVAAIWPVLRNDSNVTTSNISIKVGEHSQNIEVLSGETSLPDLAPQSHGTAASPLRVRIAADATCGQKIPLTFVASSQAGSALLQHTLVVGGMQSVALGSAEPNATLPDGDTNGLVIPVVTDFGGPVEEVKLTVDILHNSRGDLAVSLIPPGGTEITLWNNQGGHQDNLQQSLTKKMALKSAKGTWKLRIADTVPTDRGTLRSWKLEVLTTKCAQP